MLSGKVTEEAINRTKIDAIHKYFLSFCSNHVYVHCLDMVSF